MKIPKRVLKMVEKAVREKILTELEAAKMKVGTGETKNILDAFNTGLMVDLDKVRSRALDLAIHIVSQTQIFDSM